MLHVSHAVASVERYVIDERKITAVYDRQIWSGRSFTGTDYSWSMVLLLVSTFLSAFFRVNILYWLGLALLIYSYFRILSRNVSKRYEENQRYLNAKYRAVVKKNNLKKRWAQRSTYRFFKCPQCKQTVRVPKGRGKICITCPKCKTEFIKKS